MSSFSRGRYSTKSTPSYSPSTGIVHPQEKLDLFLIKGYQLVSANSVINEDLMSKLSLTTSGSMVSDSVADKELSNFQKLSQLYNASIPLMTLDDNSTSPKSAIELCQRFHQILKELELSFEASPYAKYFTRINSEENQGFWKIKDDDSLREDALWQSVSETITKMYDLGRGLILSSVNKRRSAAVSSKNSPTQTKDDPISYQQLRRKLKKLQTNGEMGNVSGANRNGTGSDMSLKNGMPKIDAKFGDDALRNGFAKARNVDSDSFFRGYYTMPTSPSSLWNNGINFNDKRFQSTTENYPVEELLELATSEANKNSANSIGDINGGSNHNDVEDDTAGITVDTNGIKNPGNQGRRVKNSNNGIIASAELPVIHEISTIPQSLSIKENELYDRLLKEKDQRIIELERQLQSEKEEVIMLRKLLLEDVGCIRNMLFEIRDK
ncbi:HBR287Cp [Eremothecium sinecaudum]|uniref:HBR287Cp n=1 Tax=Eremothecium sinecaudum TaxID=45286 RepID=A0A109UX61_9SACH|nr:HBR287Cp [Eremothecium sinecaudum]AMD19188.1 HBR287Cp [Eremothecium sinecaudum]